MGYQFDWGNYLGCNLYEMLIMDGTQEDPLDFD